MPDVGQVLLGDVDRAGRAQLSGQLEPAIIDVGDDNFARPGSPGHGDGHATDRARPGDEHVLPDEVEGKGRVHGIPQRVEAGHDVEVHPGGDLPDVGLRYDHVIGKRAVAVHPDTLRVGAEVAAAGQAVAAMPADDVPFAGDQLALGQAGHAVAGVLHRSDIFVADDQRRLDGARGPRVPFVDMHVGAADGGLLDFDQHIVDPGGGDRGLRHDEAGGGGGFDDGAHGGGHEGNWSGGKLGGMPHLTTVNGWSGRAKASARRPLNPATGWPDQGRTPCWPHPSRWSERCWMRSPGRTPVFSGSAEPSRPRPR